VPVRNVKTFETLEGVRVGDIGTKFAFNGKDNGYLFLKNVKIPRENMLSRYSKLNKKGEFYKRGNEKIGYAAMLEVRRYII